MARHLWLGLVLIGLIGCFTADGNKEDQPPAVEPGSEMNQGTGQFHSQLLEIATTYEKYPLLDPKGRLAPVMCRAPSVPPEFSASKDATTHGRKLYWLFARHLSPGSDQTDYVLAGKDNPVGQAIVKEAWLPKEVKEGVPGKEIAKGSPRRTGPVRIDGRDYHATEKSGLFIMYKLDPTTPGTDEGWVYGTVTADGKTVTSAGRVESCMGCHRAAPHDRLFGAARK